MGGSGNPRVPVVVGDSLVNKKSKRTEIAWALTVVVVVNNGAQRVILLVDVVMYPKLVVMIVLEPGMDHHVIIRKAENSNEAVKLENNMEVEYGRYPDTSRRGSCRWRFA